MDSSVTVKRTLDLASDLLKKEYVLGDNVQLEGLMRFRNNVRGVHGGRHECITVIFVMRILNSTRSKTQTETRKEDLRS